MGSSNTLRGSLLLLMLLERERTGGTGDTPPHTLLSSTGPDGEGGGDVGNKGGEENRNVQNQLMSM